MDVHWVGIIGRKGLELSKTGALCLVTDIATGNRTAVARAKIH
jgi:hypothetical protein